MITEFDDLRTEETPTPPFDRGSGVSRATALREAAPLSRLAKEPGSLFSLMGDAPRWDTLEQLAIAATSGRFADFFQVQPGGRVAACLAATELSVLRTKCSEFVERHYPEAEGQMLAELTAGLASSTCPRDLSTAAKALHGKLTLWMYLVDDGVVQWSSRWSQEDWYAPLVRALVEHQLDCWRAGLVGLPSPTPRPPSGCPKAVVGESERLFRVGRAVHECASQLHHIAPLHVLANNWEQEVSALTRELEISILAKVEEASQAPETPDEYLARHAKTGHVRVCVELNLLTYAWERGTTRMELDDCSSPYQRQAIEKANHAILRSNELCFVKDIGQAEESLLAVMIASLRAREGCPLDTRLNTSAAHGMVLAAEAGTRWGYLAMQRIIHDLRDDLLALLSLAQQVHVEARSYQEILAAAICNTTLLTWAFGYHFFNPVCQRYGSSFEAVVAVLHGDFDRYRQLLVDSAPDQPSP